MPYATFGRTESGDTIPVLLFPSKPTEDAAHARYRELLPEEYADDCPVSFDVGAVEYPEDVSDSLDKLARLEAAGVDNWEGYAFAMEMQEED